MMNGITFSDNNIREAERGELARTWNGIMAKGRMPLNARVEFFLEPAARSRSLVPPARKTTRIQFREDDGTHHIREWPSRDYKRGLLELCWFIQRKIRRIAAE